MAANPYDDVLYEGHPFSQTHPDRLATITRLFGMTPAPPESCRYLELGCGDGGNVIPMAYTLRSSCFIGIDAGARGIEKGAALAQEAGLDNVELRQLDILEAGPELGRFDYIAAHGVYSWTPPAVQEKILALCAELLNPSGVAYISYDAYPGAHIREMLGGILRYHTRRFEVPGQKIEQARAMVAFLAGARTTEDGYSILLRQEVERLERRRPATIYHDELSPHHHPVYFREFADRAAQHGLQYLGEAHFAEMQAAGQTPETLELLKHLPDLVEREQYLDFVKCRRFRQTLLCRAGVALDRNIRSEQMRGFFVRGLPGCEPLTTLPAAEALFAALRTAAPAVLSFAELCAGGLDEEVVADLILAHYACGRLELHTARPHFARAVSETPRASTLARLQARSSKYCTNLWHTPIRLEDEWSRTLLQALDGTRDRAALLEHMRRAAGDRSDEVDAAGLETSLEGLARLALLEA